MKRLLIIFSVMVLPFLSSAQKTTDSLSVPLLPKEIIKQMDLSEEQKSAMKEIVSEFKSEEIQRRKILRRKLLEVLNRKQLRLFYAWRRQQLAQRHQ